MGKTNIYRRCSPAPIRKKWRDEVTFFADNERTPGGHQIVREQISKSIVDYCYQSLHIALKFS